MPPLLLTPHDLSRLTGDAHTLISLRNLSTTLPLTDAWGRPNILQPILLSSRISLRRPFTSASSSDAVTGSTVHYGTLATEILKGCEEFARSARDEVDGAPVKTSLRALMDSLLGFLTGWEVQDRARRPTRECLLQNVSMHFFELEIFLPKASLIGSGVSLKGTFAYVDHVEGPSAYSMVLCLKQLRIPTLVGVNPNERLAKQIVLLDVEVQRWQGFCSDGEGFCELEEIVVKSTEESTFQTLEALAQHLIERIIQYILIPSCPFTSSPSLPDFSRSPLALPVPPVHIHPRIKISLSKPTAVTFADAPTVEMVLDSDPHQSHVARGVWERVAEQGDGEWRKGRGRVPFPLEGRLDAWIEREKENQS